MHIVPTSQHAVGGGMPPIPSLAPSFAGRRRGLGQDEMDSYDQWYYGVDQYGAPTGGNQNPGEIFMPSVIESNYNEADWTAAENYNPTAIDSQYSEADWVAAENAPAATTVESQYGEGDWNYAEFINSLSPQEYDSYLTDLVTAGVISPDEKQGVLSGQITLDEAISLNDPMYPTGMPSRAQQQAAAVAQQVAAKAASGAAGGSGTSMSIPTGSQPKTSAQQSAQAQVAAAKTPAQLAAAQAQLAAANAAAGQASWFDQEMVKGVKNSWLVLGGAAVALFLSGSGSNAGQSYYTVRPKHRKIGYYQNPHRRRRR